METKNKLMSQMMRISILLMK